ATPEPTRTARLAWRWAGRVPYGDVVAVMEARRAAIFEGGAEELLLCEHDPVVTLGRAARLEDVLLPAPELARRGIEVVRSSRGGQVTYHGPGQLMVYPVVRLDR